MWENTELAETVFLCHPRCTYRAVLIVPAKLREFPPIFAKMADLAGCGSLLLLANLNPRKFKQAVIVLHTSVHKRSVMRNGQQRLVVCRLLYVELNSVEWEIGWKNDMTENRHAACIVSRLRRL